MRIDLQENLRRLTQDVIGTTSNLCTLMYNSNHGGHQQVSKQT